MLFIFKICLKNECIWTKLLLGVTWATEAWNCHTIFLCILLLHWGRRETQEGRTRFAFLCCISSWKLMVSHLIFSPPSTISFNKSSHCQCLWSHPGPAHLLSCPERCLLSLSFTQLWAAPPSNMHQQRPARSPSCQFANQPTQRPASTPVSLPQLCQLPWLIHVLFI